MCTDEVWFRNFVHIVEPPWLTVWITPCRVFRAPFIQTVIPRISRLSFTTRCHVGYLLVFMSLLLPLFVRQAKITTVPLFISTRLSRQRPASVSDNACVRECTLVYQSSLFSRHLSSLFYTHREGRHALRPLWSYRPFEVCLQSPSKMRSEGSASLVRSVRREGSFTFGVPGVDNHQPTYRGGPDAALPCL